jgi:hypothetical protein
MVRSPFCEKLTVTQLVEKFPEFYWIQRLVFTIARHKFAFWVRWIQSTHYHSIDFFLRSISVLSSNLRLGLSSCFILLGDFIQILYVFIFVPTHATCPGYLILDHSNNIWLRLQIVKLFIMQLSPSSFYLVLSSWTSWVCVLPSMWETKFHIHTPPCPQRSLGCEIWCEFLNPTKLIRSN